MKFKEMAEVVEGFDKFPLWFKILLLVWYDLCEIIGMCIALLWLPGLWISTYQLKKTIKESNKFYEENGFKSPRYIIKDGDVIDLYEEE